jgi:hypothetical protein
VFERIDKKSTAFYGGRLTIIERLDATLLTEIYYNKTPTMMVVVSGMKLFFLLLFIGMDAFTSQKRRII